MIDKKKASKQAQKKERERKKIQMSWGEATQKEGKKGRSKHIHMRYRQ